MKHTFGLAWLLAGGIQVVVGLALAVMLVPAGDLNVGMVTGVILLVTGWLSIVWGFGGLRELE
jgi:hypothetical protein